jgi:ABC-2 type transport system permease protein
MNLRDMISHEWKTRLSRPATLASLAFFAATLIYGAVAGRIERDARLAAIASHTAEVSATRAKWLADLTALEEQGALAQVPPWSGSAMEVTFASYLPPAPLADFAIGQSDLLPSVGAVSLWDPDIRLFSRYEFDDPVSLALGAFDLGQAILFVLPLLLIVLSFDVLSAERDANRLLLTLAQGTSIRSLFWWRLLIRTVVALVLTFVVALLVLVLHGGTTPLAERLPFFALWALSALLYGAFWIAVIGFVASRNKSGEGNVIRLLLAWAGLTLILPAIVTSAAEAIYPAPSRPAYLAKARAVEIATELAESHIAGRFIVDHPEMVVDEASEMPAYVRTAFLVTSAIDEATRPVLEAFETAASLRDETLNVLRYVSPTIIVHGLFSDIAGASSARHRRYMAQARALKAAYAEQVGPFIVAGRRLPVREVASFPTFDFEDEALTALASRNAGALLALALVTGVLFSVADYRLQRRASWPEGA